MLNPGHSPSDNTTQRQETKLEANTPDFAITCTDTMDGWCHFAITAGGKKYECEATWLGNQPICELMMIAVNAHQHHFCQPYPADNAFRILEVEAEPGGIEVTFRFYPGQIIEITVEQYRRGTIKPEPSEIISTPYYIGYISLRQLMEQSYKAGARLFRDNGSTGTRIGWLGWEWDSDSPGFVFPLDHFVFLSEYIHGGEKVNFDQPTGEREI